VFEKRILLITISLLGLFLLVLISVVEKPIQFCSIFVFVFCVSCKCVTNVSHVAQFRNKQYLFQVLFYVRV